MNVNISNTEKSIINLKVGEKGIDYIHYFFYKDGKPLDVNGAGFTIKIWLTKNSGVGATLKKGDDINEAIGCVYYSWTVKAGEYKAEIKVSNAVEGYEEIFDNIVINVE